MKQISTKYDCPFEQHGIKPVTYFHFPLFNEHGIKMDKVLRVKKDSELHNMIKKYYNEEM